MKRAVLISSIALNLILAGLLTWSHLEARDRAFSLVAEATEAEVRLQEHILAQLEAEPPETERVKEFLRRNIESGTETSALWKAAAN
jgi:hypothetical protein